MYEQGVKCVEAPRARVAAKVLACQAVRKSDSAWLLHRRSCHGTAEITATH
jgi:hypothetical protein